MIVETQRRNLSEFGHKIFLDRYARKDGTRSSLREGSLVMVSAAEGRREVRVVAAVSGRHVVTDHNEEFPIDEVDLLIETDPDQMWQRVARAAAVAEAGIEQLTIGDMFYRALKDWKFVPAGRTLAGLGVEEHITGFNCFVVGSPHDSRSGIFRTLDEMGNLMSRGGGVGINISTLRPQNAYVRGVNGRSSGSVSWSSLYAFVTNLIIQGGSRRGALMIIINDWHPDLLDFIRVKQKAGVMEGCNMSIGISDAFMRAVDLDQNWELEFPDTTFPGYDQLWDGDLAAWKAEGRPVVVHRVVKAREIWNEITKSAWACAEPGLWFCDRARKESNSAFYPEGRIICTNPCQPDFATVATPNGIRTFADIEVGDIIWSGCQWTPIIRKVCTGVKPVYAYRTRAGTFYGTENHNIFSRGVKIPVGDAENIDICQVLGAFDGSDIDPQDVLDGLIMGDGMSKIFARDQDQQYNQVLLCVGEGDQCYFDSEVGHLIGRTYDNPMRREVKTTIALEELPLTYQRVIPDRFRFGSFVRVRGFLRGLYSANGSVVANRVTLKATSFDVIEAVQEMLSFLGISSYYTINKPKRVKFPNGEYECRQSYDLNIGTQKGRMRFGLLVGFIHPEKMNRLLATLDCKSACKPEKTTYDIVEVEYIGDMPVYSITVNAEEHAYWTGGMHVANCGEQGLPAYAVCNLGHINLGAFVEGPIGHGELDMGALQTVTRVAVRFLDNVIDVTSPYLPAIKDQVKLERRVGLGTMGLADMLIRMGLSYGSTDAMQIIEEVYSHIALWAYSESVNLARMKGPFPAWTPDMVQSGFLTRFKLGPVSGPAEQWESVWMQIRDEGVRNVTLLTQAPTGSVGTMVGASTGIEPHYAWEWITETRMGPHIDHPRIVDDWNAENPGVPLPDYFVSSMDLAPKEHVAVQAAIQRWTDASISKTTNCPEDWTQDQVAELYQLLYDSGCKGGTVYRHNSRDKQVLSPVDDKETKAVSDKIRERPYKRSGVTVSEEAPGGTVHVVMNEVNGDPFEVFCSLGRSGSDITACSEALGRLISLVLRLPSSMSPHQRLIEIIQQLDGIGGADAVGFGPNRITSLPDALAKALSRHWLGDSVEGTRKVHIDLCPDCGKLSAVREAGCMLCRSCGWSRC